MKCEICGKRNKNKRWDARFCSTCGLYLREIDKKTIIKAIDGMIDRWHSPKQFKYYGTSSHNEETIYLIKYRGVKKIIDHITFGDEVTLKEAESLIQIVSYLAFEFEYNVTKLAITLFWFVNDNLVKCDKILNY